MLSPGPLPPLPLLVLPLLLARAMKAEDEEVEDEAWPRTASAQSNGPVLAGADTGDGAGAGGFSAGDCDCGVAGLAIVPSSPWLFPLLLIDLGDLGDLPGCGPAVTWAVAVVMAGTAEAAEADDGEAVAASSLCLEAPPVEPV